MEENKQLTFFYLMGGFFLFIALGIHFFGLPSEVGRNEGAWFCSSQNGSYIEPSRENYNEGLCMFSYNNQWSFYAMVKVENEIHGSSLRKGDLCFVCWDHGSCTRDALTKIDNGTRRTTRC